MQKENDGFQNGMAYEAPKCEIMKMTDSRMVWLMKPPSVRLLKYRTKACCARVLQVNLLQNKTGEAAGIN